jgi:hypothetical protein
MGVFFKEVLRFIEDDEGLDSEKKATLVDLIQSSSLHPGLSIQWVRVCRDFLSPQFGEKPIREKTEAIQFLVRGLKKGHHRPVFLGILKVFLLMPSRPKGGVDLQPFTEIVLEKIKSEPRNQVKGQLVEILLSCPHHSPKIQDYLPGLHHPEESVCFQIVEFISSRFGVKGMISVLKEISALERSPSLFFWSKLLPLIDRHPEIFQYPEMAAINPNSLWPLFKLKQQGKGGHVFWEIPASGKWFKLRLHLISTPTQECQGENLQIRLIPPQAERPQGAYFNGKRFQLIKEDLEKRRRDVTLNHHKD